MIVLSLIGKGLRYGFEMEEFARRSRMREWAKIGMSTIYKTLAQLERDGFIESEIEESDKGPQRKAYALTPAGRERMYALVRDSLRSSESVYSDRIAGLVFLPMLPRKARQEALSATLSALQGVDDDLALRAQDETLDAMGGIVIQYYRDIYAAERTAMKALSTWLD
ncbi:MAG: PadR family transcriptional regulator [Pacificimonas sp.]